MVSVGESDYDLRQETNEFLTELAKGLSEESENLGMLLRTTVESLKALSGWEREENGGPARGSRPCSCARQRTRARQRDRPRS